MPRILTSRPRRPGQGQVSAEWSTPIGKAGKAKAQPGVSWWLLEPYRSDRAVFAAKTKTLGPTASDERLVIAQVGWGEV